MNILPTSLIPWRISLEALKQQTALILSLWLSRWAFADDGVAFVDKGPPLSPEKEQAMSVLLMTITNTWLMAQH